MSFVATQKAHNALRWLIARQGYRSGDQVFVAWEMAGKPVPDPFASTFESFGGEAADWTFDGSGANAGCGASGDGGASGGGGDNAGCGAAVPRVLRRSSARRAASASASGSAAAVSLAVSSSPPPPTAAHA